MLAQRLLRLGLVGRAPARRNAGSGVGDAEDLEQFLDGAVLAVGAVKRDERDVGPLGLEPLNQVMSRIERDDVVALGAAHPQPERRSRATPAAQATARL